MDWKTQYTKLDATPVKLLKAALQVVNPVVLSDDNVRSLWRNVHFQAHTWLSMYDHNGRLADRLVLPAKWPRDGLWCVDDRREAGRGIWIFFRTRPDDARAVPKTFKGKVEVESNWSLMNATVAETDGLIRHRISLLLVDLLNELMGETANDKGATPSTRVAQFSAPPSTPQPLMAAPPSTPQPLMMAAPPSTPQPATSADVDSGANGDEGAVDDACALVDAGPSGHPHQQLQG